MTHPSTSASQGSGRGLTREHSGSSSLKRSVQAVFEGKKMQHLKFSRIRDQRDDDTLLVLPSLCYPSHMLPIISLIVD